MEEILVRIAICAAAAIVLFKHHREIRDALDALRNNFPRGPRPMHPSPANDGALLRRRRARR